jgi:hypothetical protein
MSDTPKTYESDTPETCEAVERWQQGKINIFDEMARLERERDEAVESAGITFLMAERHALENQLETMTAKALGWQKQAELNANLLVECREKAERYRLEANAMITKLHELQTYADKLADGLPAGMLPRDVENLREANAGLAEDLQNAERERDEARAGRDEADVCRKLTRECDELREQLYIAVGMLSTHPKFENKHPEEVWEIVKEAAK